MYINTSLAELPPHKLVFQSPRSLSLSDKKLGITQERNLKKKKEEVPTVTKINGVWVLQQE